MVRGKMIRRMLLAALVGVLAAPAAAQTPVAPAPVATPAAYRPLRVSEVVAVRPVTGNPPFGFAWSPHGKRYLYRVAGARDDAPATVRVVDLATGRDRELLAAKTSARGSRSRAIDQIAWAPDDARVAIVDAGALEVVDVGTGARRSVGAGADDPQFSPDGTKLAFVRDGNLFVANLAAGAVRVRRLTTGGSATQLDGDPTGSIVKSSMWSTRTRGRRGATRSRFCGSTTHPSRRIRSRTFGRSSTRSNGSGILSPAARIQKRRCAS